jgi:luciferase family oxidoreductase group 1
MRYFEPAEEGQRIRAVPGEGQKVPVWILGSSLYGAQLAAILGLPYAFASHFAPAELDHAIEVYRTRFQPSQHLDKPYLMLGLNVVAAPTDAEAKRLFSSQQQAFVNLRTGRAGPLPPPVQDYEQTLDPVAKATLDQALSQAVVGSPETVVQGVDAFIRRTGADELMVTAQIFDHAARVRSYEILTDANRTLSEAA